MIHPSINVYTNIYIYILEFTVHFAHKLCAYQFYRFSFVKWISTSIIMIFVLLLLLLLSTSIFFSPAVFYFSLPFLFLFVLFLLYFYFVFIICMHASHVSQHSSVSNHSTDCFFIFVQLYDSFTVWWNCVQQQ